jgi:hypothetical protein
MTIHQTVNARRVHSHFANGAPKERRVFISMAFSLPRRFCGENIKVHVGLLSFCDKFWSPVSPVVV